MPELNREEVLMRAIERMRYDDALHFIGAPTADTPTITLSPYHVEYLLLARGTVQYRLYHQNTLVGVENVNETRDNRKLEWVRLQLRDHLMSLGLGDMTYHIAEMGVITPIDEETHRLPRLNFKAMPADFRKTRITQTAKNADYW